MATAKPLPSGQCWCGCGEPVGAGKFFAHGHDRWAEAHVIHRHYGDTVAFLDHHGYGPHGKSARQEAERPGPALARPEQAAGVVEDRPEPAGVSDPSRVFERERRTFEAHKDDLLRDEGSYVVIRGDVVAGTWPTYEEAIEAGYRRFGLGRFFVKQILKAEPVVLLTRDVLPCPT